MQPATPAATVTNTSASAKAAPFLLRHAPRHPRTRRLAERAWSLYPPAALLLGVLVLAGGCSMFGVGDQGTGATTMADPTTGPGDADGPGTTVDAILYPSYPSETPLAGDADGRATIRYGRDRIELANLSESPWSGARIWINERYSTLLPYTKPGEIRSIHFDFLRDESGARFPTNNTSIRIEKIELITGDERANVRFGLGY